MQTSARTKFTDPTLEYIKKNYPDRKITAEDYVSMNGIPVSEYGAERIAECPRKFRRKIEKMARQASKNLKRE
jgi:hypothetical protein